MPSLYLHIPFCLRKCSYCDFYSIAATPRDIHEYQRLLLLQMERAATHGWQGPVTTVYFGGGTPSLLDPADVGRLLKTADTLFGLAGDAEISLEANPGTVTQASLSGYRSAGINRLSLGLQSCHDSQLSRLGRMHDRNEGLQAVKLARQAGFGNLSLDLMFALPEQTLPELANELATFVELGAEHLSCYGLTAERGTPLALQVAAGDIRLPDEDFYADAFMLVHESLLAAGYEHYEIANYARQGYTCRHNLAYWQRQPYLGIGAGAHSFDADRWGSRWEVPADLAAYRQALSRGKEPMQLLERFDRDSALSETIYLALRTRRGISDTELSHRFGCTLQGAFPDAVTASSQWLMQIDGHWSFTPAGWLLFDRLIVPFL